MSVATPPSSPPDSTRENPASLPEQGPLPAPGREAIARAWSSQQTLLVAIVILGVAAMLVGVALAERIAQRNKVLPGVEVAGKDVGGKSEQQVLRIVERESARLTSAPLRVRAGNRVLTADPAQIGLEVDGPATVRAARVAGRDHNPIDQLSGVVLRRLRADEVPLSIAVDRARFEELLDTWVAETGEGLVDGGLEFEGTTVVVVPPRSGTGIQRGEARKRIFAALGRGETEIITLPVGPTQPRVNRAEVERAAKRARLLLAAPVTVTVDTTPTTITPEQLAPMLSTQAARGELRIVVSPEGLNAALAPALAPIQTEPQDATWAVDGPSVTLVPAVVGRKANLEKVGNAIGRGRHAVTVSFTEAQPARSTEWAKSLNITQRLASYTTEHPCCQARVTNIHTAADVINKMIVPAGDTFSLNDALGPRTAEKGYVKAPAIAGDLSYEDEYGGGVSQLSTTLYNAVFFACLEDVTHAVHALYIDRYPKGREATLNYPSIDNKFRNDTKSAILIRTFYSSGSITVSLYGNPGSRTCTDTDPRVLQTINPEIEYVDDPALPAGQQKQLEPGHTGYVVEYTRTIIVPGQADKTQRWTERYSMTKTKIARGTGPAPPTTTTTPPAAPPPAPPTTPPAPAPGA